MTEHVAADSLQLPEGHYGKLNSEQKKKLAEMWQVLFNTFEDPSTHQIGGSSEGGAVADGPSIGKDGTPQGPKDDKAKEAKAHHDEQQALKELLEKHSTEDVHEAFWKFCGGDYPDLIILKFLRARKVC